VLVRAVGPEAAITVCVSPALSRRRTLLWSNGDAQLPLCKRRHHVHERPSVMFGRRNRAEVVSLGVDTCRPTTRLEVRMTVQARDEEIYDDEP
jgi:hypothetical protein